MKKLLAVFWLARVSLGLQAQTNLELFRTNQVVNITNKDGKVFTNIKIVIIRPNSFVYVAPEGLGGGTMNFKDLTEEDKPRFNYNAAASATADKAEALIKQQQRQALAQQAAQQLFQAEMWQKVDASKNPFAATGDTLRVDQITKDGVLASYNFKDVEGGWRHMIYFLKDCPNQNAISEGVTVGGPFYRIGTYTYTSTLGASETVQCLACSRHTAYLYQVGQAGAASSYEKKAGEQSLKEQQEEEAVPKSQRDAVWKRVQAHEKKFPRPVWAGPGETNEIPGFLTVRQVTKEGVLATDDPRDTDHPGDYYFVKDWPAHDLFTGSSLQGVGPPFYEIGTYTYESVVGARRTLPCLTCSKHAAFQYYLTH